MIRNVRSLWLATGLLLASVICASGLLAQTVDIPTAQVEATARAALDIGDAPTAYELAQAIVAEQPDNLAAQLILARAALRLGRPEEARDAAKTVWRQTRAVDLRYAAARLAAAASVELGQAGASKRWLSRSIALAPTPAARAQLRTDYAVVRNAAPTQANFSFTLYPSDNVNGGATNAFFVVDGVPFVGNLSGSAQALSGYEARLNYSLSHRVLLTDRARTSLTFSLNTRDVWLSDEARDKAPDLTNDDLAYRNAAIGVRQEWLDPKFPILWTTSAELGGIV
ncbi:MAG: tetratricopeptide repeat protein, partial [Pseudomonadota bacterium]